jgi:hypothetical protein
MSSDFFHSVYSEMDYFLQQKYKHVEACIRENRLQLIFPSEDNAIHGAADIRGYLDKTCPRVPTTVVQENRHVFLYEGGA